MKSYKAWRWLFFVALIAMGYFIYTDYQEAHELATLSSQKHNTPQACSVLQDPYGLTNLEENHPEALANLANACK